MGFFYPLAKRFDFTVSGEEGVKMHPEMLLKLVSGYNRVKAFITDIISYLEILPRSG